MAFDAGQAIAYLTMDTGQYAKDISGAKQLLAQLTDDSLGASAKLSAAADAANQLGVTMTTTATTAVAAVGALSVKTFAGFDDAMRQVQATMAANEADMDKLTAAAKEMGATTRYSASEAGEALNYLALAGYNADQAVAALPKTLALAQAGGLDLAYASDLATDAMSALGLGIDQLEQFTDQMTRTSQKSNTNVAQLGEAILTVGGTAKQLAGGTVELNTQLGILADNGIKGSEGGAVLRNVIMALTAPMEQAADQMAALGLSAYDADGNLRSTAEIFRDLDSALSQLTAEERNQALSKIFNVNDLKGVEALLANCTDRYDELSTQIVSSAGATQAMAETMEAGIGGSFRNLSSAAEGAAIAFGEALAPTVQTVADGITQLASGFASLPESTQQTIANVALLAAGIGPVLIAGSKLISMGQTLMAVMSGPAGWITLGVAGVAALVAGMERLRETLAPTAQEEWEKMLEGVSEDTTQRMSATINGTVNADIDASPAKSALAQTAEELEASFAEFGLTDDQIAAIQGMIGQGYEAIYAKCLEFGLNEEQSATLAKQVDTLNTLIQGKLENLSVDMDSATALRLVNEAEGNKVRFVAACEAMGLSDSDIEQLGVVFDEMNGRVAERIPNLLKTIQDKLTDGEADSPEVVSGLRKTVKDAFDSALADVDLWESLEIGKLDPDAPDFETACATIREQANATRTDLESLRTETDTFVSEMAGRSTADVQARLGELDQIEARVDQVLTKIGLANTSARDVGNAQYELTKAGATLNADTVAQGVAWAYQNYKLDTETIQESAANARAEADAAWQQGLLTDNQHLAAEQEIDATLAEESARVLEVYRTRMGELLAGIGEAYAGLEPEKAANLERLGELAGAQEQIDALILAIRDTEATPEQLAAAQAALQGIADSVMPEEGFRFDTGGPVGTYASALKTAIDGQMTQLMTSFEGENNPIPQLLTGIAESGAAQPLELDLTQVNAALSACFGTAGVESAEAYAQSILAEAGQAQRAGASIGESGAAGAASTAGSYLSKGADAGQGYANGIRSKISTVRAAAAALAREGAAALAQAQDSHSPARLHMGLGHDAGDGYVLGIRDKIPEAQRANADLVNLSLAKRSYGADPAKSVGAGGNPASSAGGSGGVVLNLHIDTVRVNDESDVSRYANLLGTYINDRNYR